MQKTSPYLVGTYRYPVIEGKEYRISEVFSDSLYKDLDDPENKETISYYVANYFNLYKYLMKTLGVKDEEDATSILHELYIKLDKDPDYEIRVNEDGNIVSLQNFIKHQLKIVKKRFYHQVSEVNKNEKSSTVKGEDTEEDEDLFNFIADSKIKDMSDYIDQDIEDLINDCRKFRYYLRKIDLFELLYIAASLINSKFEGMDQYYRMLRTRGISENDSSRLIALAKRNISINNLLECITRNISIDNREYVLLAIEKNVYGLDSLKAAIAQMS